jgi:hypothetical protein
MNRDTRIKRIQEIIDRDKLNPFAIQEIPWEDDLVPMNVYKIPLEYLVYNKYNGRILSRTKSLEKQNYSIDVETEDGKNAIEELLYESKKDRNDKTLRNLREFGQQKVGIITKDGIIIDGNRRAMLLNRIDKFDYFKAVVLPVTLEESPLEIEKLETSFQMGEDEKLGYNATEKYLKSKGLYRNLSGRKFSLETIDEDAVKKIADWMGENTSEVKRYLTTMDIMDEYLEYFEYDGIYTQLDDREDQFLNLERWLKTYYGETSTKAFDGYKDEDVDDLKSIAFDYIRVRPKYDGKEFRNLGDGQRGSHFFGNKEIWKSFSKYHFEKLEELPEETPIDNTSKDLHRHLDDRDTKFYDATKNEEGESFFIENLKNHKYKLGYNEAAGKPEKLVKRASQTLDAIKTNHANFSTPEVQSQVEELGNKVLTMLQKTSPSKVLSQIMNLLESIDTEKIPEDEIEATHEKVSAINKLTYQILKKL